MGLIFKSAEERFINREMKKLKKRTNRTMTVANYAGNLERCKMIFGQTIASERLVALERRKNNLSDQMQMARIRDAAVGLLAAQEVEMELKSVESAQDLAYAEKSMKKMLGKIYRMNHYLSITKKDLKNELGMQFDDSVETMDFSDRVEILDEGFIEDLVAGQRFSDVLKRKTANTAQINSIPLDSIDFSAAVKQGADDIKDILKDDAEQR